MTEDKKQWLGGCAFFLVIGAVFTFFIIADSRSSHEPEEDGLTKEQYTLELQLAADENFALLPSTPHIHTDDGLSPEEALAKLGGEH